MNNKFIKKKFSLFNSTHSLPIMAANSLWIAADGAVIDEEFDEDFPERAALKSDKDEDFAK